MMNQPLNERLREERKRKGLTQEQLAEMLSVSRQTISHWETGRAAPDYESLRLLAEALETTPSQLLGEEASLPSEKPVSPLQAEPSPKAERFSLSRFSWLFAAVLILCIAAAVMLFLHFSRPDASAITPDDFSHSSPRVEGRAWIDIVVYQTPVPRMPTQKATLYQWMYPIYLREENGVDFTIDLYEAWNFYHNGDIFYNYYPGEDIPWQNALTSTISGGKSRVFNIGNTSHTPLIGTGVQFTGTDEFGNKLFFRKYVPYSMEVQP